MSINTKTSFGTFTVEEENLVMLNGKSKAKNLKIADLQKAFNESFLLVGSDLGNTSTYVGGFTSESIKAKDDKGKFLAPDVHIKTHAMFHDIKSYSRIVEEDADQARIKSAVGIVASSYGLMFSGVRSEEQSKKLSGAVDLLHKYDIHPSVGWNSESKSESVEFSGINGKKLTLVMRKKYAMPTPKI